MVYGYIRVSRSDQSLNRQIDSLVQHNPTLNKKNIFHDKKSGKNFERANYLKLKKKLCAGDELVIHELDRFGRNKQEIKIELEWLKNNGVIPRILNIPTTLANYPKGQEWLAEMVNNILFEVYSTLAEQERATLSRRTKEGLAATRRRGQIVGRPPLPSDKLELALKMYDDEKFTVSEIMSATGIGRSTLYKYVKQKRVEEENY